MLTCLACWSVQLSALYWLQRMSCGGHVWPLPIYLSSHVLGHKMSLHKGSREKSGGVTWCKFLQVVLQPAVQVSKWGQVEDGTSNRVYIWWWRAGGGKCKLIFPLIGCRLGLVGKYKALAAESGPNSLIFGTIMRNCVLIHLGVPLPFVTGTWFVLNKGPCSVNI